MTASLTGKRITAEASCHEPYFEEGDLVHLVRTYNEPGHGTREHPEATSHYTLTRSHPVLNISRELADPGQWCGSSYGSSETYVGPVQVVKVLKAKNGGCGGSRYAVRRLT